MIERNENFSKFTCVGDLIIVIKFNVKLLENLSSKLFYTANLMKEEKIWTF